MSEQNHNSSIDIDGKAPKRRYINPTEPDSGEWLHEQIMRYRRPGDLKDDEYARIEAMLRLAPPLSSDELRANGMENMPNYSRGDLPMRIADEERKWTDLVNSHAGLWEVHIPGNPPEATEMINSVFSAALNETWMEQAKHVLFMQVVFRQFACYGVGPALWTDCYDPSPISRMAADFRFPPEMMLDFSNFSEAALYDHINAQELWRAVNSPFAETEGWKENRVMEVLKHRSWESRQECFESRTKAETALRSGINMWENYKSARVRVIHVWLEEFDEKDGKSVTYLVIARAENSKWLIIREKPFEYPSPAEFLCLAADRVGSDGTIGGLRGIGMEIRPRCEANDLLGMAMGFGAFNSSVPRYSAPNQASADRAEEIVIKPCGTVLPQGITEVESHIDIDPAIKLVTINNNEMDSMQGRYDLNAPNKGGVQRTAEESRQDAAKETETRLSQQMPLTTTFFKPLGENFCRRICTFPRDANGVPLKRKGWEVVVKFDDKLRESMLGQMLGPNIPEWLKRIKPKVNFNSSNTPGGLDKKLLKAQETSKAIPLMTSQRQRDAALNSWMIAIHGWRGAQPYMNQSEDNIAAQPWQERVTMENAVLKSGSGIVALEMQDHLRHLGPLDPQAQGHCGFVLREILSWMQGGHPQFETDPLDGLGDMIETLLAFKEHIDMHLSYASHNPALVESNAIQPYFNFVSQTEQFLSKMVKTFEAGMAKRQQQGIGVDPKAAAFMQQTQAKIQSMQQMTQAQIQMDNLKHANKMGLQTELAQTRSQLKTAQTVFDMANRAQQARTDNIIQQTEALRSQAQVAQQITATAQANQAKHEAQEAQKEAKAAEKANAKSAANKAS